MDTWLIVTTIAIFGVGNAGLFLYKFGSLETRVDMNEARLGRTEEKVDDFLLGEGGRGGRGSIRHFS